MIENFLIYIYFGHFFLIIPYLIKSLFWSQFKIKWINQLFSNSSKHFSPKTIQ